MTVRRPALRYHGSKYRLAPWIISHFPAHKVYVEPYGGGGAVLLRKPRVGHEVYNDLDGEVVNVFRQLRDNGEELRRRIYLTPFSRAEYALSFEVSEDPVEQARRTLVRSFMGHGSNSLRREVKSGFRSKSWRSNTGAGVDWMSLPAAMEATVDRLRGVILENRPALEVVQQHDGPETLFYIDPPYPRSVRSNNGHGRCACCSYAHEMTDEQHAELGEALQGLRAAVVVSSYPGELYDRLYAGWRRVDREALADHGLARTEVLWINRPAEGSLFP